MRPNLKDRDVRQSVWLWLEEEHAKDQNTLMLDELGIMNGSTRIDVAVVNGEITGFELKSERDTLERLPAQRDLYNRVLDRVSLVVAENHLSDALEIVPEWWGIWIATSNSTGDVAIHKERSAQINMVLDAEDVCSFLWRDEALSLLERYDAANGVRSKSRDILYRRIAEVLDLNTIREEVRHTLKTRQGWRADRRFQPHDGLRQL